MKPTIERTPRSAARAAASAIASASATVFASGFSHSTCLPASSAAIAISAWESPGVTMSTMSMSSRAITSRQSVADSAQPHFCGRRGDGIRIPATTTAIVGVGQHGARAVHIGLPAIIFTEHLDLTGWTAAPEDFAEPNATSSIKTASCNPRPWTSLATSIPFSGACLHFPELRVLTGVEFGQPHLDRQAADALIDLSALDRVNGSLRTLPFAGLPQRDGHHVPRSP